MTEYRHYITRWDSQPDGAVHAALYARRLLNKGTPEEMEIDILGHKPVPVIVPAFATALEKKALFRRYARALKEGFLSTPGAPPGAEITLLQADMDEQQPGSK
mgnify:FL=1